MDGFDVARYLAALLLVLGLLAAFAFIMRRLYGQGLLPSSLTGADRRRMRVSETLVLDPRRRVVIVAIDGREHVLLLGAGQETVLEAKDACAAPVQPVFTPVSLPDDEISREANTGTGREAAAR